MFRGFRRRSSAARSVKLDTELLRGLLDTKIKAVISVEYCYYGKIIAFNDEHIVFLDNRGKTHLFAYPRIMSLDPERD